MPTGYSNATGVNPFKGKVRAAFSPEHKEKLSKSGIGRTPWNKGKKLMPVGEKTKDKMRASHKRGEEHPNWKGGKPKCLSCGVQLSAYTYTYCNKCRYENLTGEKAPNWRGGVTPDIFRIRGSEKYFRWRSAVFKRDNYTCVVCGDNIGGNLEADHIIPYICIMDGLKTKYGENNLYQGAMEDELLWDINNGRTLCQSCHIKTNTYGGRSRKKE